MTELERFRAAIPLLDERAYLFNGGIAPLAAPVKAALDDWVTCWGSDPLAHRADYFGAWTKLRARFAALVGVDTEDVAVTENTSRATNLGVRMLALPPGSNVLVDDTTYPTMAWAFLAQGDVEVRRVQPSPDESVLDAFARCADAQTRCLAVSHVSALDGYRHDLPSLAELASRLGARLFVDAAQSAGVVPIDCRRDGVDVLVTTSMKWLLGPPGIAFLAVNPEVAAAGPIGDAGYVSARIGDSYELTELPEFPSGAGRAEVGLAALPLIPAADEGLRLIQDAGVARILDRVTALVDQLHEGLIRRGLDVLTPADSRCRAGVVAFQVAGAEALAGSVRALGVDVWGYPSARVRVDPHGFNTTDDIDRFLEGFDAWQSTTALG